MVVKKWKLPLRPDHTFRLILSESESDFPEIAKLTGYDLDEIKSLFGMAGRRGVIFNAIVLDKTMETYIHEIDHVAFHIMEHFSLKENEFHCMMLEWLFTKSFPLMKKLVV